ncbi:BTB/POZ domain-containing protein 6 [Aphelenchoides avenae]|nr:BTB/POZ domain-containing protein 6 [Aphelenchus avenae]
MFFGDFKRERVVKIPDTSPDVFRALLKFIYTDEADLTDDNLASLLSLADKYLVTDLFDRCVQHVTAANVCRFLPLAERYAGLSEHCWSSALKNGYAVLNSDHFFDLPQELLAKLLASDDLQVDEKTVFSRAVDWAKRRLEKDNRECEPSSIRAVLGDALYLIRFPLFDANDFVDGPLASGILSDQETASLTEWFTNVWTPKRPVLFSTKPRRGSNIERIIGEFGLVQQFHCEHEAQATSSGSLREKCETARTSCIHGDGDPRICLTCYQVYCGISGCSRRDGIVDHYLRTDHALYFDGLSILCQPCFASMHQDLATKL